MLGAQLSGAKQSLESEPSQESNLTYLSTFERIERPILARKLISTSHRNVSTRIEELWMIEQVGHLHHKVEVHPLRDRR